MRIDEEPILGEPVTIDMPNACINPVDFSKTWIDKYGISRKNGFDPVECSWRQDKDNGEILVMKKRTKRLKTVCKISYEYDHFSTQGRWTAKYNTVPEPPKSSKPFWGARALFNSSDRRIDTLPDRQALSEGATQEFVDSLNKHMKEVSRIVGNPSLYDLESWDERYSKWQLLIDEDIKIAVQTNLHGYMYIQAWTEE